MSVIIVEKSRVIQLKTDIVLDNEGSFDIIKTEQPELYIPWVIDEPKVSLPAYIEHIKKLSLRNLNMMYDEQVLRLTSEVTGSEKTTWTKQEREAGEFLEHKDVTKLKFINTLASSRFVPLEILATKIIEKADLYNKAVATLLGFKQRQEDVLNSLTTLQECMVYLKALNSVYNIDDFYNYKPDISLEDKYIIDIEELEILSDRKNKNDLDERTFYN